MARKTTRPDMIRPHDERIHVTDLGALAARMAARFPGRWFWHGYADGHGRYDLAHHRPGWGVTTVMGFTRKGMQSGQPMWPVDEHNRLDIADHLAVCEVSYRDDIVGFDNDVARWLTAANPTAINALFADLGHAHNILRRTCRCGPGGGEWEPGRSQPTDWVTGEPIPHHCDCPLYTIELPATASDDVWANIAKARTRINEQANP